MDGTIISLTDDDIAKVLESSSNHPSKQTVILRNLLESCSVIRNAQMNPENNILIDLLHVTTDLTIETLRRHLKLYRPNTGPKGFSIMESSISMKIYTSDQLLRFTHPGGVNYFEDLLAILLQKQVFNL
jgi:hypothetical protein